MKLHRLWNAALLALVAIAPLGAEPKRLVLEPPASPMTFDVRVNVGMDSFTGTVEAYTLDLTVPDGATVPDHAVLSVPIASLKTGKDKRDKAMREWIEDAKFPSIDFKLTALKPAATAGDYQAAGELTIHGKSLPVSFPVKIEQTADAMKITGSLVVDYRNFDLKIIRMMAVLTVKPEVTVKFTASGKLQ